MQAAGGLKKRKKRNLAKVSNSDVVLYDPDADVFDLYALEPSHKSHQQKYGNQFDGSAEFGRRTPPRYQKNGRRESETYVNELEDSRFARNPRITRDPRYSSRGGSDIDLEDGWGSPYRGNSGSSTNPVKDHNRPVLLSSNSIARLRHVFALGITSFAFPWRYNTKTQHVDKWSPFLESVWRVVWTCTTIQNTCITGFQFYSFFSRINTDENGSWRPVFMSSFSVLWYCYSIWLNVTMYYYKDAILHYLNTLLELNRQLVDEYLITTEGHKEGGQILLNVSIPTNITQTFISISLFLTFPNSPWYLYSYIYSPDHGWWWLIPGAIQEYLMVGQILSVYLLIAWITVAHANSVEFWLQEAHKLNDSDMTKKELRYAHNAIKVYRRLQILTTLFNDAMAPMAVAVVKVINWTALIPCGFVLIRSMNGKIVEEFPGILTYPFGVIDCVTCSYGLLQMSARMYDISASLLTSWSQTRHKALRKILVSCPVLKVKIGRLYFVTTSTTVTYFKSCLDYIINAIVSFE